MALTVPPRQGEFPTFIDSTMRSTLVGCETDFYWSWMRKFIAAEISVDLLAGGAFAAGLEAARKSFYKDNQSKEDSLYLGLIALTKHWGDFEAPEKHTKQYHVMLMALEDYFREYPMDTDAIQPYRDSNGKPAIEFTFAIPIPGTIHPVTKNPILYAGRFDLIGVYNSSIFVVDEKTTGQLGASFAKKWDLRGQFIGYVWAAKILGNLPVVGALVRGIGLYKTNPQFRYMQVPVYIDDWMIDRWLIDLKLNINHAISAWESGIYSQNWDASCTAYGGCSKRILCKSKNPEPWVSNFFVRNNWNPLAKNPEE